MGMRLYLIYIILTFIIVSCRKSETSPDSQKQKSANVNKPKLLADIGKIYYENNCVQCHGSKGAKDNILMYEIKNDKYKFEFFKDYISNEDSLLKAANQQALLIKDKYDIKNQYTHVFRFNNDEIKSIMHYLKQ